MQKVKINSAAPSAGKRKYMQ